jgi:outer membrane immunogenic protein
MRTKVIAAAAVAGLFGSSAIAADVPLQRSVPAAPASSWTGLYAGVNLGGAWTAKGSHDTVIGGGQVGYNWQFGSLVAGAETDIQAMALRASSLLTNPLGAAVTNNTSADYLGTARARIGMVHDQWINYVTGGLAYTTVHHDGAGVVGVTGTYSGSNSKTGYAVGGGVEWAFLDRWSAKAEYLFTEFSGNTNVYTTTTPVITVNYNALKFNILRLGVNYHFAP